MSKSDPNRVLRRLPIVVGWLGGILLFVNRMFTSELTNSQSRADVLGVILSALLILTGMLWQQVQSRTPDSVKLVGEEGFEIAPELPEVVKTELAWASRLLLLNTATRSLVVVYQGKVILRRGILAQKSEVTPGAILNRVLEKQKPVYLVDVKAYPGKIEFDYLPENTQGIICQPLATEGAMILGANAPRSYTKQDENWIAGIADKLTVSLKNLELKSKDY
ncbi:cofactor assembly of complex C subunit B [Brunnivagina elsteri]|uniref:Cofactor assembly of complex C subunit B n=1 Tax=Brunnivagina elsteri CCALA 953 TaxID=987040 RepID=A0A2A2TA54_9CYAN|nr:cofactor assembly of complex C subunit B [Calothrix elsteri]PAX45795.1 hypothetical protein CK510_29785 [Calothrix elsteri CCALA 953]